MFSKSANKPGRRSLALRLTLWYAGSAFLLIAASTLLLYWALAASLDREDDQVLADTVNVLVAIIEKQPDPVSALKQEAELEPPARHNAPLLIRIQDSTGMLLTESPGMESELPAGLFPSPVAREQEWSGQELQSPTGNPYRLLAVSAKLGSRGGFLIQVGLGQGFEEGVLASYRRTLWGLLSAALITCALVGYMVAHRGLRPVSEVTATAARIRSSTLGERMDLAGLPTELASLGATFNAMLNRLQDSFARLTQFSADIAHELRTPVHNLRGEIEVALGRGRAAEEYRQVLESALEECTRLARLIDRLLFLARTEDPDAALERTELDLTRELEIAREFYDAAAQESHIDLHTSAPAHVRACIDRVLFQQAIGNVLENALNHTPQGGKIEIALEGNGDLVVVLISDSGCGIAEQHLDRICDRLYRVDVARAGRRGGVGLGLAIVSRIMSLHGGRMEIRSTVNQGTTVTLLWPVRESPAAHMTNL